MKQIVLLLIVLTFASCKKAEDRACMKAIGQPTTLEVALPNFDKLFVGAKLEVVLVQDSVNKLVIKGGENLVKHVSFELDDKGYMRLENTNKCFALRNYKKSKITVEVHFTDLRRMLYEGTYDLTTQGYINVPTFNFEIKDGGGTVYLNVNCDELVANQGHGFGDFVLHGTAKNANMYVISNGYANTENFTVEEQLVFSSNSPVASTINLDGVKAKIDLLGSGDINYIGTPVSVQLTRTGTGEWKQKN